MAQSWTQQKIQSLKLVSISEDLPTCGDLVRVSLERMCITQSDFSSYALGGLGRAKLAAPHILGAAACCRVVDPGKSKLRIGDSVVPSPIKGEIAPNGEVHFNASRPDTAYAGIPPQLGFLRDSFLVSERELLPIAPHVLPEIACMAEPLAVALHAMRKPQLNSNSRVLILAETNPVAEILARLIAPLVASVVLHTEVGQTLREQSEKIIRISSRINEMRGYYESLIDDMKPNLIFELSNNPIALEVAVAVATPEASVVFIHEPGYPVSFDLAVAHDKELALHSIFSCGQSLPEAVAYINQGRGVLSGLVRSVHSFNAADKAFDSLMSERGDLRTIQIAGIARD